MDTALMHVYTYNGVKLLSCTAYFVFPFVSCVYSFHYVFPLYFHSKLENFLSQLILRQKEETG